MVHERDFVLPDDVKAMAAAALAHRLLLKPELWVRGVQAEQIVQDLLDRTPVPKAD
jgi:MoxR-like ATPase